MALQSISEILQRIPIHDGQVNGTPVSGKSLEGSSNTHSSDRGRDSMDSDGTVKIHGKTYQTVALRVQMLRSEHPNWSIKTKICSIDDAVVVMKARIYDETGRLIGTGHAEERRDSSQINRTSALENCETSAIGRALAACGYGGTEYASANEVENAIHQQKRSTSVTQVVLEQTPNVQIDDENIRVSEAGIRRAMHLYGKEDINLEEFAESVKEATIDLDAEHKLALWKHFDSKERALLKQLKGAF